MELAKSLSFDQIITVGPHFKNAEAGVTSFLTTVDLIEFLEETTINSGNILLKASRIALEKGFGIYKIRLNIKEFCKSHEIKDLT